MKKLLISIVASLAFALHLMAASIAFSLVSTQATNLSQVTGFTNSLQITQITASTAGAGGAYQVYDAPTTNLQFTNASYISTSSYATNWITTWTNYYGATNSFTNVALIDYSITNAGTTNFYLQRYNSVVPTNGSVTIQGTANFIFGATFTNAAASTVNYTVFYRQ